MTAFADLGCPPKVSVITPCFNGEAYLDAYFCSLLAQIYQSIELIFINDGSTDQTEILFHQYDQQLNAKGIETIYIAQENAGQAAAINRGLAVFSGEYIMWPDADDLLAPDNIEKKVAYLEAHQDAGLVCCGVRIIRSPKGQAVEFGNNSFVACENLFDALIRSKGAYVWGIAYMARGSALLDALGGRYIYESRVGQNYQLLLPLTYKYPCGFIDEQLASYVVRADSHFHSVKSARAKLQRTFDVEDVLVHVLASMDMRPCDREVYEQYVSEKYTKARFELACELSDRDLMAKTKQELDKRYGASLQRNLIYCLGRIGIFGCIVQVRTCVAGALREAKWTVLGKVSWFA